MLAANDSYFYCHDGRSLTNTQTVFNVPHYPDKLKIYLTSDSDCWKVRCFHKGRTYTRSLKTENKGRAQELAKDFFNELMAQSITKQQHTPKAKPVLRYSFRYLAEQLLAQERLKVLRGEMAEHSLTMLTSRLNKHLIPHFGEMHINKITSDQITELFDFLMSLRLSSITISQYIDALRKVFNLALANEVLRKIPAMPKIKKTSVPRGGFTVKEYALMMRTSKALAKIEEVEKPITHRNRAGGIYTERERFPDEFAWLIGFMVNSFVRPVDIKLIQHKHIQIIRGERVYLRLTLPETKKHTAQIVTLRPAVRIYEALVNIWLHTAMFVVKTISSCLKLKIGKRLFT